MICVKHADLWIAVNEDDTETCVACERDDALSEPATVQRIMQMGTESLSPELHDKLCEVVDALRWARKALADAANEDDTESCVACDRDALKAKLAEAEKCWRCKGTGAVLNSAADIAVGKPVNPVGQPCPQCGKK